MEGVVGIAGVVALLLLAGGLGALVRPRNVSVRWLAASAGLVVLNDALLTNLYGLLPDLLDGDWNWQGKLLALGGTLLVASLPGFGWRSCGLTLRQAPGSLAPALAVAGVYAAVFLVLAWMFPNEPASAETIAFQLTLPSLEEEAFYRGVLLAALARAFTGRKRLLGVDWSWGALVSCALFGLAHAFGFSDGGFRFDAVAMLLTAGPSLLAVWLALRTRSILAPAVLHSFGNSILLLV